MVPVNWQCSVILDLSYGSKADVIFSFPSLLDFLLDSKEYFPNLQRVED
jgi:hypothetical protein